jgi:hypothetical protein
VYQKMRTHLGSDRGIMIISIAVPVSWADIAGLQTLGNKDFAHKQGFCAIRRLCKERNASRVRVHQRLMQLHEQLLPPNDSILYVF